jgi:hypothetical protein
MEVVMAEFLTEKQQADLKFFYSKLNDLLADPLYRHKYALIHDEKIEGIFDTFENAITDAASKFPPCDYVIQHIISKTEVSGFLYSAFAPA